jgi:hypothetical protein
MRGIRQNRSRVQIGWVIVPGLFAPGLLYYVTQRGDFGNEKCNKALAEISIISLLS